MVKAIQTRTCIEMRRNISNKPLVAKPLKKSNTFRVVGCHEASKQQVATATRSINMTQIIK